MRTSISLPDDAVARAQKRAAELRLSPDQFFAVAVAHYLGYLDSISLARDIDEILSRADPDDPAVNGDHAAGDIVAA
jgi:hypothetical protein